MTACGNWVRDHNNYICVYIQPGPPHLVQVTDDVILWWLTRDGPCRIWAAAAVAIKVVDQGNLSYNVLT